MTKLEKMLKYVSEHNEFYKNRIKEYGIKDPLDITQWPILTRKELQENRYNMFSDGYKAKYFNQQLRRQISSGSSGIPVNVYWDYKDWYASNISLWRKRLQWYGIHPDDKYVMFTLNAFNIKNDGETVYYINDPVNVLSVNVSLIQNESGYDRLIDIINDFQPKWLYIQPFVLNRLLKAYKQFGKIPPSTLKYIESVGELLASDLRRRAVEFFNVPLANMYGSEEMNGIAYECPEHHMHVLDNNVLVEIVNSEGNGNFSNGETIITNLNNYGMPLIRYAQGDQILLSSSQQICDCGCSSYFIELIKGRIFENVLWDNQNDLNPFKLMEIMAEVNNQVNDIIVEYKYIYRISDNKLQCLMYIRQENSGWKDNIKKLVYEIFNRKVNIMRNVVMLDVLFVNQAIYDNKKSRFFEIME